MTDVSIHEVLSIHDDYMPGGSPRDKQRKLDEVLDITHDTAVSVRELTKKVDELSHDFQMITDSLKDQTKSLQDITGQFQLLVEQFSRLEVKRLEEIIKMQQEIAQLKKTVHTELAACRESINKEVKTYLSAIDHDRERDTLSFEL